MNKELFEGCIAKFNEYISACHTMLDHVTSKSDILNMSLANIQNLKKFCVNEHSRQDKIFSEVRHLIGMGNLSPVQTSLLIKCFKEYSAYRSDIKTIAMHLNSLDDLPGLPTKAEFQLSVLGNFKLTSELRGGKEEESTIVKETDSDEIRVDSTETTDIQLNKDLTFVLPNGYVIGDVKALDKFAPVTVCLSNASRKTVISQLMIGITPVKEGGITWTLEGNKVTVLPRTDNAIKHFVRYYKA